MKNSKSDFLKKTAITEDQFSGNEKINGSLDLSSLTSIPEGFNPTVGGYLYLSSLTSIPEGFNPTVGGSLYLSSLTSIPEGFNPTVGGYLDLRSLTSIPEGFNPTVGGSLDLRSRLNAKTKPFPKDFIFSWNNGKFIKVDGILCEVLEKKGNVYRIKVAGKTIESHLVRNKSNWAHGETIEKAKEDLRFKVISEKLKKDPIKEDTEITIQYYRIVTGACESGVKMWMDQNGVTKDRYKAKDLLPLLEKTNAYGVEKFKSLLTF